MSEEIITRVESNAFVLGDGDGVMGNRVILCTSHSMWCVCVCKCFISLWGRKFMLNLFGRYLLRTLRQTKRSRESLLFY